MEIELTPSVPAAPQEPVVTPSETVVEPVVTPEVDPKPAETLYKMPDGRELTGAEVKAEYEKLLPDYTQKSQKLAELTREPNINNEPEWKKEGYVPKSYAEIIEIAERQALERIQSAAQADEQARLELSKQVDNAVAAIKSKDPKLDENALFAHANKYRFRDLNMAYENMAEMRRVALTTEERVLKGVAKKIDPIATGGASGGSVGAGGSVQYGGIGNYSGAQEFLSRVKGK